MRQIKWLGQTIDSDCTAACDKVYGAPSANPDPAALIACFVTQCAGNQTTPPTVVPPPGFTLPAGMTLPGGFTIPAGWTIPGGTPLPQGNLPGGVLPPGWTLPTSIIPPGFTLPSSWTLPSNWTLPGPLTLPTALTVPAGVPVPPGLPSVPPPPPVSPAPPPPKEPAKSDNTALWVVGGLAAAAFVGIIVMSSKEIGHGVAENPRQYVYPKRHAWPINDRYHAIKALQFAKWPQNKPERDDVLRAVGKRWGRDPEVRAKMREYFPRTANRYLRV